MSWDQIGFVFVLLYMAGVFVGVRWFAAGRLGSLQSAERKVVLYGLAIAGVVALSILGGTGLILLLLTALPAFFGVLTAD